MLAIRPSLRFAFLSLLILAACIRSEEQPKSPLLKVTIYYSAEDDRWEKTEQKIEEAAAPYIKIINLEKVNIDQKEGYARLIQAERDLDIEPKDRGDTLAVVGHFGLVNRGGRQRDIDQFLGPVLNRLLIKNDLKERRKADAAAFAQEQFGKDAKLDPAGETEGDPYFRVLEGGALRGWVVDVYQPIGCPVCGDAQFLLAVDERLRVKELKPVHDLEVWGRPLAKDRQEAFLSQFHKREPAKREQVDVISGATKTSLAYQHSMNFVLEELRKRTENPGKDEPKAPPKKPLPPKVRSKE